MIESMNLPGSEPRSAIQRRTSLVAWLVGLILLFLASIAIIWISIAGETRWWIAGVALALVSVVLAFICMLMLMDVIREILESDTGRNFWHDPKWRKLEQRRFVLVWTEVVLYLLASYLILCPLALSYMGPDSSLLGMRSIGSFGIELFGAVATNFVILVCIAVVAFLVGIAPITSVRRTIVEEMDGIQERHRFRPTAEN